MPANLTPDYRAAEARFRAAETTEDKLAALEDMYATIPKHKGTEKLQADIKRRISKLRDKESQFGRKGKHVDEFHVVKQGAGQVALVGPPGSGKSLLLARLTGAEPEVADYPYTTRRPVPGMMEYQDMAIQLIDLPPVSAEHMEGGIAGAIRIADAAALVLDASDVTLLDRIEEVRGELSNSRTVIAGDEPEANRQSSGAVVVPAVIVANKMDLDGSGDNLEVLREFYGDEFKVQPVSALTGEGLEELKRRLFDILGVIRVYTKLPGKPPDMDKPFTIKKGTTLIDFAALVHKDMARSLRFAKAWGEGLIDGAQISRDHVLKDGYVVELHA